MLVVRVDVIGVKFKAILVEKVVLHAAGAEDVVCVVVVSSIKLFGKVWQEKPLVVVVVVAQLAEVRQSMVYCCCSLATL